MQGSLARVFTRPAVWLLLGGVSLLVLAACSGDDGAPGKDGNDFTGGPGPNDPLPGVAMAITALEGGSGPNGNFRPGDTMTVRFTVKNDAGEALELSELDRGAIMVSGPTFNYQRVITSQGDLRDRAVKQSDGSYTYRFAMPIPGTYAAPYNDTTSLTDGELTGQALLDGTYTVGIEARKDYTIEEVTYRDPGNVTMNFLMGAATALAPREVVRLDNCNQCHNQLNAHGTNRNRIENCLLCHTAGAEDRNVADVEGGTPGVSIDFKVMIHKIHTGKHLPSVLGVTTNPDGTRKYDAAKQPYKIVGFNNSVHDYSDVALPAWPSLESPMPADLGYDALTGDAPDLEDSMRSGPVNCAACHGDPDGAGPLPAPAQGDLIYSQPTRTSCTSCHEDWVPNLPYRANTNGMPGQDSDATCTQCHAVSGDPLAVMDAHVHPLVDPAKATGVNFAIASVAEAGTNNADGTIDPGEKIAVTFTVKDDAGTDLVPTTLSRWEIAVSGPTSNPNLLHFNSVSGDAVGAGPTYTINVPQQIQLERVGVSTGALDTFPATTRIPHWNTAGTPTSVSLRTTTGFAGALAAAAAPPQNYIDVMTGEGASFNADEYIVLEDTVGGQEEYLRIRWIEGDRLWFSSPRSPDRPQGPRIAHAIGSSVTVVTVAPVASGNYTLDTNTGVITETSEFGAGTVLVSYTSDFVVPATYGGSLNTSPDLDASWGDWAGLPVVDGTYTLGMWASQTFDVVVSGIPNQTTSYREASDPATQDFLFGTATTIEPNLRVDSAQTCNACHVDIQFHGGGRRGYENCLLCHGIAGAEDRPRYLSPNGAATPGVTIDFRTMLHKIHHGKALSKAADYTVVGFGGTSFMYDKIGFPALPGGTAQCAVCHGADSEAWLEPATRNHPMSGVLPTRSWRAACNSCHDSDAALAHADANTSPSGSEACAICHGKGENEHVERVHRQR